MRENKQKQKTKLNGLLFERKFAFYKRKEDDLWEEGTPVEKGMQESESVINKFHEGYNPWNLKAAINNPDEVIFGVRDRMMDPMGGFNTLSGNTILNNRVSFKLEHLAVQAPEAYKHIIDEEVRRRGGKGVDYTWSGARKKMERQVAADFFTFNIRAGQDYNHLLGNLQAQIQGLNFIGGPGFEDSRHNRINLANPVAFNEFDVATQGGAPGSAPGNETVVIHWHQEDFITIKNKLERSGMWADFSTQENAREFIHLKFRHSLLQRTVVEEAAKLSNDKYNPQRLITWLENDLTTQALTEDAEYRTFLNNAPSNFLARCTLRRITTAEQLNLPGNRDLLRELKQAQQEAKDRVRPNSLYNQLNKILLPKQLENIHKSKETQTMVAYLFSKINDPEDGINTREYIERLSGGRHEIDEVLVGINNIIDTFDDKQTQIAELGAEITRLTALTFTGTTAAQMRANRDQQLRTLQKEMLGVQIQVMKDIINLRKIIDLNKSKIPGWPIGSLNAFITNPTFQSAASTPADIEAFITSFRTFNPGGINIFIHLNSLVKVLKKEVGKAKGEKNEKMDSRALLYLLVKRDLEGKGKTEETGIHGESVLTTNLLIADNKEAKIYGYTNQHVAKGLEKSTPKVLKEIFQSAGFFTPTLSGKSALEHVVDTDPDLVMFKDINLFSTRKDLIQMMHRYGMASPSKIREFIEKLGECIRGIEIEKDTWPKKILAEKVRVLDQDVPHLERVIHLLTLLETQITTENFLKSVEEEEEMEPALDRQKLILKMLEEQTQNDKGLDESIANKLQGHDARFKRMFIKKDIKAEYNKAMDEIQDLPKDEQETELIKRGLNKRARSRGLISPRFGRAMRKGLIGALTPLSWIAQGFGFVGKKIGKYSLEYMKNKWKIIEPELKKGREEWKARTGGAIMRIPLYSVAIVGGIASWGLCLPSRILGGIIDKAKGKAKS